jgi:diguanylate cyclase (GGDEF)-like protein/PAS domain S-box-containing protein
MVAAGSHGEHPSAGPMTPAPDPVLAERAPVGVAELDLEGRIVQANPALCRTLGQPADQLLGLELRVLLHPDDRANFPLAGEDGGGVLECRVVQSDGDVREVRFHLSRRPDERAGLLVFVEDLTDQRSRLRWVERSLDERYTKLLHNIDDVITVCNPDGVIVKNLGHFDELLGWPPSHWEGRVIFELAHPDEQAGSRADFQRLLQLPGVPVVRQYRTLHRDGRWAWLEFTAINLLEDPSVQAVILISRNVTAKKQAEAIQQRQAAIFELIACAAPLDLVLGQLAQMVEDSTNGARAGIFLLEDDGLRMGAGARLDPRIIDLIHGSTAGSWFGSLREALMSGRATAVVDTSVAPEYASHRGLLADAGVLATAAVPVLDAPDAGAARGAIVVHLDEARALDANEELVIVSAARLAAIAVQRHESERQLSHLAHHDKLTGLPNRLLLQSRLDEGIRRARTHRSSIAVMFLDLDNFKIVNDSLGHAAGDDILVGFAERLSKLLRPGDVVGRFGGDEFVVLLQNVSDVADATPVAERLLDDLRRPFLIDENTVFLTVSVGIAISHGGRDSGEVLLRNADSAMYQAKARGRARIEVYDEGLPERATRRLQLEGDLHRALDASQFVLHWQPKIALATGRIVSAEALVRWAHPERGLILPADFIAITEELELITRVGEWVIAESIRQCSDLQAAHGEEAPASIAVNVSALQLSAPHIVESVTNVLNRWHWEPSRLVLELSESVLMDEVSDAKTMLMRLKDMGVQLAIDDFGTGYSSLSYLHRFPVDQVKLDRAFVSSITADGEGSPIARAVINMAHALDISVTAEGVETEAQLLGLRRLGCDRAQGFLFARPMSAADFSTLLTRKPRYGTPASAA